MVACTDLPTEAAPVPALTITAGHSPYSQRLYRPGEIVVVGGTAGAALEPGQRYFIRRLQPPLEGRPPSPKSPGAIRTAGWLTIVAMDARSTLARVDFACDAVEAGDYLEPFSEPTLPEPLAGTSPNFDDMGVVLFGSDRRMVFGSGDFLNIDRGTAAGLTPGMRVSFFRDRRNGTPLVLMGEGLVLEAGPTTARVVVSSAQDAIYAGDYVAAQK